MQAGHAVSAVAYARLARFVELLLIENRRLNLTGVQEATELWRGHVCDSLALWPRVVASGAVKVVVPSEDGEEAILVTLRRGDFLGELALLDGAPRSASAIALEQTEALALPREQFRALVASEPAIRDALLASLSAELRRLTTHVAELHFLDLTGRLAARLARLAEEHGEVLANGSIRLDAPLTQSDLAAMIGATRQSVNKLLGEFEADGLLRIERDSIVVPDLARLSSAARR